MSRTCANLLIVFFLIFSTSEGVCQSENFKYTKYVHEIVNEFIQEMEQDFGFECTVTGGSMPYNIRGITVSFNTNHHASIEEARYLEVESIQRLLEKINKHEKIRPFLNIFPFTASNVHVSIHFSDITKGVYFNDLSRVSSVLGVLYYSVTDENTYQITNLKKESFEDALNILKTHQKRFQSKMNSTGDDYKKVF